MSMKKILIIEDNKLLAESLRRQLKVHFVVDVVHRGEDGIDFEPALRGFSMTVDELFGSLRIDA